MPGEPSLFEWQDGVPHFRGLRVEQRSIDVAGHTFRVACLKDPADLLDEPDYAKAFLEEDRAPYGLELWPASIMLAEYVLQNDPGGGGQAIEIGCGLALVSMAATAAGWNVTATDNEPTALQFAEYATNLNELVIPAYELMDWHHPPSGKQYDRVFAADVLYQLIDHGPLLACIDTLLAVNGVALVADPNRGVADRFRSMAESHGFIVDMLPSAASTPDGRHVEGRIFRLSRGSTA